MSVGSARTHAANGNWSMAAVEALPESVFASLYRQRTAHQLRHLPSGHWQLTADGESWLLPRAKDALRITHIGDHPPTRVLEKYLRGPISVEAGDRVVDVGAMIGEFARRVPTDNVVALDIDTRNAECLQHNIDGEVKRVGAWCADTRKTVTKTTNTSESSLFGLDTDEAGEQFETAVARLDTVLSGPVDLLKVEAEGAEPEVLQGASGLDVRQVVVDVSPERAGESPAAMCSALLRDRGYHVQRHGSVLTAVRGGTHD